MSFCEPFLAAPTKNSPKENGVRGEKKGESVKFNIYHSPSPLSKG